MQQNLVVNLNKLVKIRFKEGEEFVIKIVGEKQINQMEKSEEFLVDTKTPIAQAILGRGVGEKIKYMVEDNIQQVSILEIQ